MNITNNEGWTVLHYSVRSGSFELTKIFIDTETDISLKIKDGSNCLHTAAVKGNSNLIETLVNKYKFDVNAANNEGCTALHCSAQNGSYELINFFIKNGVDVLLKTKNRMNCLHIAASKGHFRLCKTLTDICDFDMNMDDNKGWTALHHSARSDNCELIKFLLTQELTFHSMQMRKETIFILQQPKKISLSLRLLLLVHIILMSM